MFSLSKILWLQDYLMKSVIYGSQAEKGEMPTLDRLRAERLFPDSEKETVKCFRYFTWMPPRCFLRGVFWTCPTRRTQGMLERLTSSSSLARKGRSYTSAPAGWPLIKDRGFYILLYLHGNCIMSETRL